jgi:hypothetical protein
MKIKFGDDASKGFIRSFLEQQPEALSLGSDDFVAALAQRATEQMVAPLVQERMEAQQAQGVMVGENDAQTLTQTIVQAMQPQTQHDKDVEGALLKRHVVAQVKDPAFSMVSSALSNYKHSPLRSQKTQELDKEAQALQKALHASKDAMKKSVLDALGEGADAEGVDSAVEHLFTKLPTMLKHASDDVSFAKKVWIEVHASLPDREGHALPDGVVDGFVAAVAQYQDIKKRQSVYAEHVADFVANMPELAVNPRVLEHAQQRFNEAADAVFVAHTRQLQRDTTQSWGERVQALMRLLTILVQVSTVSLKPSAMFRIIGDKLRHQIPKFR